MVSWPFFFSIQHANELHTSMRLHSFRPNLSFSCFSALDRHVCASAKQRPQLRQGSPVKYQQALNHGLNCSDCFLRSNAKYKTGQILLSSKSLVSSVTKQIFSHCNDEIFFCQRILEAITNTAIRAALCQTQSKHSSISKEKIHASNWSRQWDSSHSGGSSSANQYPDKEFCSERTHQPMKTLIPDQHMKYTSLSANSRLLNRSEIIPGVPCHILLL